MFEPVRHQGEVLGALSLEKRPGEQVSGAERKLVADLAAQAGLVLRNAALTEDLLATIEELRRSRQRLVAAQDEERRRLERNLHDGAQQRIVALTVQLGLLERVVERDCVTWPAGSTRRSWPIRGSSRRSRRRSAGRRCR
jgi:signal transduction histidine kinase